MADNDLQILAASVLERTELLSEKDRAVVAQLMDLVDTVARVEEIPRDRFEELAETSATMKDLNALRLAALEKGVWTVGQVLQRLSETDAQPAVLQTQAAVLESLGGSARLAALSMVVSNDVDRRLGKDGA